MSTRCNVRIEDGHDDVLWFYRHSDGYPEGALPTLKRFMSWRKAGLIRENVSQAAGWLIVLGHHEYLGDGVSYPPSSQGILGWKVGAYEPTTGVHGDIEYLYVLDLKECSIKVFKVIWVDEGFGPHKYQLIETITDFARTAANP